MPLEPASILCCSSATDDGCVELTLREYQVCDTICNSGDEAMSFSELKRASDLHQEVLSRILKRLTVHRIIEKVEGGKYKRLPECSQ